MSAPGFHQIMAAMTNGHERLGVGNVWRITAKKRDFYLDPVGDFGEVFHLSLHGPGDSFVEHRFHLRVDRQSVASARDNNHFVSHGVPRKGFSFSGREIAPGAFLVARIRWTWDLQRQRYRAAALTGQSPQIEDHQSGRLLSAMLAPNSAWDLDVVVSYNQPYWPDAAISQRADARLGPLANSAGMWLTATSCHRLLKTSPIPEDLVMPPPEPGQTPNRILSGGVGPNGVDDLYWFVESVTSREAIESLD